MLNLQKWPILKGARRLPNFHLPKCLRKRNNMSNSDSGRITKHIVFSKWTFHLGFGVRWATLLKRGVDELSQQAKANRWVIWFPLPPTPHPKKEQDTKNPANRTKTRHQNQNPANPADPQPSNSASPFRVPGSSPPSREPPEAPRRMATCPMLRASQTRSCTCFSFCLVCSCLFIWVALVWLRLMLLCALSVFLLGVLFFTRVLG